MRPSTVAEVVARVVAWHNRHPLARRITAAQVQGVGVVAMPFVLPGSEAAAETPPREPTLFDVIDLPAEGTAPAAEAAPAPAPSLRERALAAAASGEPAAGLPPAEPPPALPVLDPPQTWRERLKAVWARLRPAARRGFSEDFIEPLSPRRVARFALRHGSLLAPPPAAGPVRHVLEDDGLCARGTVQTWHLRTAAVEVGSRRIRVLLGEGPDAAVIGPRMWSPGRLAGSAAAWLLAMGGLIGAQMWRHGALDAAPAVAHHEAPAASAPAAAAASAPREPAPDRSEHAVVVAAATEASAPQAVVAVPSQAASAVDVEPAPAPRQEAPASGHAPAASAAAPAAPAASPAIVVTSQGAPVAKVPAAGWPVNIRPVIDIETARAAKRDSAAARAQAAERPTQVAAAAQQAPERAAPMPAGDGKVYALAARSTRNRAASELLLGLMKTAAAASGDKGHHTEVLPSQQGWRAIWWPFHSRQEAEKAQALLVNVGLEAELVEF